MSDKLRIAKQFIAALPYSGALGMELQELDGGVAVIDMPYDERLIGDPRTGVLHVGVDGYLLRGRGDEPPQQSRRDGDD